jgi:Serine dehydrogenase proteinase
MSILGFPVFRYIDVNDSEEVLRAIYLTDPAVPLDIVLHTPEDWCWPRCKSPAPFTSIRAR